MAQAKYERNGALTANITSYLNTAISKESLRQNPEKAGLPSGVGASSGIRGTNALFVAGVDLHDIKRRETQVYIVVFEYCCRAL